MRHINFLLSVTNDSPEIFHVKKAYLEPIYLVKVTFLNRFSFGRT